MTPFNDIPAHHSYEYGTDRRARYARAAETFRVLGHTDRLQIVELLEGGDISVGALEDQLELPQPVISRHLAILRRVGLVTWRRDGTSVFYSLIDEPGVMTIIKSAL